MVQTISKCPMAGGNAVFRARAMLALVSNKIYFNDRVLCNQAGIAYKQQENKKSKFKLYPNPASDKITIEYEMVKDSHARLIITNAIGQRVKDFALIDEISSMNFSIADIAPGMHYFLIQCKNERIENGKFVVIR
jgi:hypothetical protein